MFHIHTLSGDNYDITLESLLHRKDVHDISKKSPVRKFINGEMRGDVNSGTGHTLSYAEKRYRESMNIRNELEPVFHAYQIMNSPVKTTTPETKITEAWKSFKSSGICHMPVISGDGRIIGIVSDRDLLRHLLISDDMIINRTDEVIGNIMTREVVTASRVTDIRRIARVMFQEHIGCMPILDDEKHLEGIITRSDILHAIINIPQLKLWG